MKENLESQVSKAKSLLDVLIVMKQKTMLDTHVATLAYVQEKIQEPSENSEYQYGILRVKPFPLYENQSEYSIQAYYFSNTYEEGDIVLIVFCDLNFIMSLNVADKKPRNTTDTQTHSLKYGIVIKI